MEISVEEQWVAVCGKIWDDRHAARQRKVGMADTNHFQQII